MKVVPGKKLIMEMKDIMNTIRGLACSQGFYTRLYNDLCDIQNHDPERFAELSDELEAQEFHSPLDVVLYFEC